MFLLVTNSGCLGDQYSDLGTQTPGPKKHLNESSTRVFCNVNICNLEIVLQRNLKTDRARVFLRNLRGANFEKSATWH